MANETPTPGETPEAAQESEDATAAPADETPPDPDWFKLELAEIESAELKPINAASLDLISQDPEKQKARDKTLKDYTEATEASGELRKLYDLAHRKFVEVASDILKSPTDGALLDDWIKNYLAADKPVHKLIAQQCALASRLTGQTKYRFAKVLHTKSEAERRGKNYAEWLVPAASIKARIDGYLTDIDKINAALDAGEPAAWPIYQFWFVVAPKHLRLRDTPVAEADAPGYDKIVAALTGAIECRKAWLKSGPERGDGSLYLVDAADYREKRKDSLGLWSDALTDYAKAVAENKFRPDEPGKLLQRVKELADGEAAAVKALPGA